MTSPNSFVTTLDLKWEKPLLTYFKNEGYQISHPPYTLFSAKKPSLNCTLYASGKLVVQGKGCAEFVEFFLEPHILQTFSHSHPHADITYSSHIGIDESGKGDFFGPLCVAGVYVEASQFPLLQKMGVKDSKTLTDKTILKLAEAIRSACLTHVVKINPPKYNELYTSFKNLNHLLAWGHATAIEKLVAASECQEVIIDQFADERVVERALERKGLHVHLTQRHRGEEDLAVAAASILARAAFVSGLELLGQEVGVVLPKGCSAQTTAVGKEIRRRWGEAKLREISKTHFKTLDAILGNTRE